MHEFKEQMTAVNPHPLANPFNTRRFGNFNVNKALHGGYIKTAVNPKNLIVPQSTYSYEDVVNYQKRLTVPNQHDIPLIIQQQYYNKDWGQTESIASILNRLDNGQYCKNMKFADPNLSQRDIEYWKHANEESKRLEAQMTDDQKNLLTQLNNGEFFKLSRLELEA